MLEYAVQSAVPLLVRGCDFDLVREATCWHWHGKDGAGNALELRNLPMLGLPLENAALALQAFALIEPSWRPELLIEALRSTRVTGRLDRRTIRWKGRELVIVLDVGHNPHAAAYLATQLRQQPKSGRRLAVFGLLADKDLSGVIDELQPVIDTWAVAPLATSRSRSAAELSSSLMETGRYRHYLPWNISGTRATV